ncbi:hypothetical protein CWI79_07910 [Pseudidiomarina salinarum]|nr:hypothetical protein CWI79_07910 [Pseudidiomarina salinarum]
MIGVALGLSPPSSSRSWRTHLFIVEIPTFIVSAASSRNSVLKLHFGLLLMLSPNCLLAHDSTSN